MDEELDKIVENIKYTLDTIISLIVLMMLMQIVIVVGLFFYITW
jgi:hypothetical protein